MVGKIEFKNTKKQTVINIVSNVIAYLCSIGISIFLTPFLINSIGKDTYSFYPISNTIIHYITIVATALNAIGSRFISVSLFQKDEENANKYFSSMIIADCVLSSIALVPCVLVIIFLTKILNVPLNSVEAVRFLFSFIFSAAIVSILTSAFGVATFSKNRVDLRSYRELFVAVLKTSLFIIIYKFFSPSIVYVGLVTFICACITAMIQFLYTKKLTPELKFSFRNCSKTHLKEIISSSIWTTINSLGTLLLSGTTLLIANIFYGSESSGTLSICVTIPNILNGIITMLIGVFYPTLTYKNVSEDKDSFVKAINNVQKFIGAIGSAVTTVFCCFAISFYKLWVPLENSVELAKYTYIIFSQYLVVSCFWVLTNVFVILNKVKVPAIATLICGAFNIGSQVLISVFHLNIIFLPLCSTILCCLLCGVFMPLYASREISISRFSFYKPFLSCAFISLFIALIGFVISHFLKLNTWFLFVLFGIGYGVLSLVVYLLVIAGPKRLFTILKELRSEKNGK